MSSALEEVLEQLHVVLALLNDALQGLKHASKSVEESTQLLTQVWHGASAPDADQALAALNGAQSAMNQTWENAARVRSIVQQYLLSLGGNAAARPTLDAPATEDHCRAVTVGSWRGTTAAGHARDQGRAIGRPPERLKRRPIREVRSVEELNRLFDVLSAGGEEIEKPTYAGRLLVLPDGTTIGYRLKSKTTVEPTIDISTRDGYSLKIHVNVRGWD
ncbi:hypothetical protein [Saccharomonospora iraqiensis]|uniref:hypothetical protein n=1 Tax=Saccharomonospora iraqiensis TaxID=52698 RepID=UPI00022E3886|nr:hypothetical protein [Saccharomonospora iraqiensis]